MRAESPRGLRRRARAGARSARRRGGGPPPVGEPLSPGVPGILPPRPDPPPRGRRVWFLRGSPNACPDHLRASSLGSPVCRRLPLCRAPFTLAAKALGPNNHVARGEAVGAEAVGEGFVPRRPRHQRRDQPGTCFHHDGVRARQDGVRARQDGVRARQDGVRARQDVVRARQPPVEYYLSRDRWLSTGASRLSRARQPAELLQLGEPSEPAQAAQPPVAPAPHPGYTLRGVARAPRACPRRQRGMRRWRSAAAQRALDI
eukprot:gene4996-biopygen12581